MPFLFDDLSKVEELIHHPPFGLIVDVDGTISPIALSPEMAQVTPACRRHLRALSKVLPLVAAVSGRPAGEAKRLVGVASLVYVGNHGLERWEKGRVILEPSAARFRGAMKGVAASLIRMAAQPGVVVEDKGTTISIHYRMAVDPGAVRESIIAVALSFAATRGLRVTEGRMVVEIRPPVDIDKGSALMRLVKDYDLKAALYLGDDITDIDAFLALRSWREQGQGKSLGVAVLNPESGARLLEKADAYVKGVGDVERLLAWMVERATRPTCQDPRVDDRATS